MPSGPQWTVCGRVTGFPEDFLRLNDLVDLRFRGMRFRIHHVEARRADSRDDQVAAFDKGVAGEWRQGRRTGIPAEMVKLVSLVRHRHSVDDLTVCRRAGLHIDYRERIRLREVRTEQQRVSKVLRWSFHGKLRRCMKSWIRPHRNTSLDHGQISHAPSVGRLTCFWNTFVTNATGLKCYQCLPAMRSITIRS